MSKHILPVCIC